LVVDQLAFYFFSGVSLELTAHTSIPDSDL